MFIAEGSDWFWWYGDDHSSEHDLQFDELFRRHVRNVYRALEKPIPEELFVTNITTQPLVVPIEAPSGFIAPTIDGDVTSYFEWVGAGAATGDSAAGAMHQVSGGGAPLSLVEFGFDLDHLYIRVDGPRPMADLLGHELNLSIKFLKPQGVRVVAEWGEDAFAILLQRRQGDGRWLPADYPGFAGAIGRVVEIRIPFVALRVRTSDPVAFLVALNRGTAELDHLPRHRAIELAVPDRRFPALNWTA
jgi:hypothetical protein